MYKIGKAADNNIVVHNPYISRYHALLKIDGNNNFILEDLDSTNGTYVNEKRIRRTTVTLADKIRLGKDYILDIPAILKDTNDYSLPFLALKEVYDTYSEAKVKIQSRNMLKPDLFKHFLLHSSACRV
ncbi:MAG: FHA domain-containing protein [Tannerellaceae bacterium]|nr:FHA domain-containing protein [Tannerellaceae bacterium]